MKKLTASCLALTLTGLLAGCAAPRYADVPAPTRFENSKQQQIQAAQHWQLIAENVASQLAADLRNKAGERAVYVPQPGGEQPFVEGFRELLITALVAQGLPVSTEAQGALTVDVKYSIYRFRPGRTQSTYYYGDATLLAAGLWAIGGIAAGEVSNAAGVAAGAKLLTVAAGVEGFSWLRNDVGGRGQYTDGPVPRSEILLTASIVDGTRIVSRRSNIYYTSDDEAGLYWNRSAKGGAQLLQVKGDDCEGKKTCVR